MSAAEERSSISASAYGLIWPHVCVCVCDSPHKLGKMNGFYSSPCWSHVAIKWTFGDAPRTGDSHGPRRGQNSNQCPGSSNYCLLWLIIPQSFDQAIAPVSREWGSGEGFAGL